MATMEESFRHQLSRATSEAADERTLIQSPAIRPARLRSLDSATHIEAANEGDNTLILQLLIQANQCDLAEDFQSRLDEPLYQPSDRLLLRRNQKLIGHVQVSKLVGWFHGQRCPISRLQDFTTLPEFRSNHFDSALLEAAEEVAVNEGAFLGLVRTDCPEWFEQQGWSRCRGQGHTRANTRAILSHLDSHPARRRSRTTQIEIRTWRHFELDCLVKLYQQLATNMWGSWQRSLENWQWLVGRKAHDQILIAVEHAAEKPDDDLTVDVNNANEVDPASEVNASELSILGYAIVRDSCIVEMLTLPGHSSVRTLLLGQACRDAIDRDHHFVSLHTPAVDPLHEFLVTAGGSWIADSAAAGGQWMAKLLAPERWIERLYPVLHERAREAGIRRPLEIDFALGTQCQQFTLTRRSSRLEDIGSSAVAVQCDWHSLQDLFTSNLTFPEAIAQGRLRTPHLSLLRTLAALFPPKLFWQSPFPMLRL